MIESIDTPAGSDLTAALETARTQRGDSLLDLTNGRPTLVVFLRHSGCPFCKEALADVSSQRERIERGGAGVVLVYQWDAGGADELFEQAGLDDLPRIADPNRELYDAFGVARGSAWQIGGPVVWWRVLTAGLRGHTIGKEMLGDVMQMPGCFLVHKGKLLKRYRYRSQASRPDYCAVAAG